MDVLYLRALPLAVPANLDLQVSAGGLIKPAKSHLPGTYSLATPLTTPYPAKDLDFALANL